MVLLLDISYEAKQFLVLILNIFYLLCWISFIAPGPRYDSYELWLFTNSTLCRASKSPTMCLSLGRVTSLSYQNIHETFLSVFLLSNIFSKSQLFVPIWILIVLKYSIWESSRNKLKNHSVSSIVLTFHCLNKLF